MKQNLVVLLADFFNLFEIHPTKCVCYPGMEPQTGKFNKFLFIFYSIFVYLCLLLRTQQQHKLLLIVSCDNMYNLFLFL